MNTLTIEKPSIKEHPIPFSTPMVQAILEGRKTQTRRIVDRTALKWLNEGFTAEFVAMPENHLCRYGYSKDILWVRETFSLMKDSLLYNHFPNLESRYLYKADWKESQIPALAIKKWKPFIFMPKAACRLFLEIVKIKVERLQDISEEDAVAEGIEKQVSGTEGMAVSYKNYLSEGYIDMNPKKSFQSLWTKINGAESWKQNPFVWVIGFQQIKR